MQVSRALRDFLVSLVGLILVIVLQAYISVISKSDYIWISGSTASVSEYSSRRKKGLQIRMDAARHWYRLSPKYYSAFFDKNIPRELVVGTEISLRVSHSEIIEPNRPVLAADTPIVWIHGIEVGGSVLFGKEGHERLVFRDLLFGYLLILVFFAASVWTGAKWILFKRKAHRIY